MTHNFPDFDDDSILLLLEDDGPRGLGRVLAYWVCKDRAEAERYNQLGALCDAADLFKGKAIPDDVATEIMTHGEFRASYANRMPLVNRMM